MTSDTIKIDTYTARFDDAIQPRIEFDGTEEVAITDSADARELDAFRRRLRESGYELTWEECETDADGEEWDVYSLSRLPGTGDE